jgi:hypothetical protein
MLLNFKVAAVGSDLATATKAPTHVQFLGRTFGQIGDCLNVFFQTIQAVP